MYTNQNESLYTYSTQLGRSYNIKTKEEQVKKGGKFKRNILGEQNYYYLNKNMSNKARHNSIQFQKLMKVKVTLERKIIIPEINTQKHITGVTWTC